MKHVTCNSRPSSWRSASGPNFSDANFASAFDSSVLRNCGCPVHASLQLAFRAHALQRSACLMLLFLRRLLHFPNLVLWFCSSSSSAWVSVPPQLAALPQWLHHVLLLTSWSLKFPRGFAPVSVCDTACPCSLPARHFAVVREIELLSPTSDSRRLREWLVVPVVIVLTHLVSVRKLPVLVFNVFLVSSSLTLCWMCRPSVSFMLSSCSAFGFSQVFLFFFCLLLAMLFFCLLLAMLFSCLLLALLFRFFSSSLSCCWVCSFDSPELLTCWCLFPSPSSILRVGLRVSSALVLLLTLLTRIRSSEYRRPSSIVFLRLRAAFGNLVLPLFFFWSPLALLVVVLSLFSVWTHSLLIVIWATCVLHVASCERRAPPTALCGSLRLRGSLLASSNTQHCATSWLLVRGTCTRSTFYNNVVCCLWGLVSLSHATSPSRARLKCLSLIVACFAVSFALRSDAIARLILTLLSCIARGRPHALKFCCIQSFI